MKFVLMTLLFLASPAVLAEEDNPDPLEGINRVTYKFNDAADRVLLKPAARGYRAITPQPVRRGVGNFFSNLDDVNNAVNNLLQGKVGDSMSDMVRLTVNTTIGVGGLFDPATAFGVTKNEEDFGQTFSVWGVPRGPYLVIPFLGPSTITDTVSRPFNSALDPVRYLYPVDHRNVLMGVRLIDQREGLLNAEGAVFGDRYLFIRDAYLQRRDYLINDGQVSDPFADDF